MKKAGLILAFVFVLSLVLPVGAAGNGEAATKTLGELEIGDKVVDKSWEWEYRTGENYTDTGETKPVIWVVVAKYHYGPGSGVTLLAEELIGRFAFDNSTNIHRLGSNHWGDSGTDESAAHGLRPWLNSTGIYAGEGFYQAFSTSFKDLLLTTTVPNRTNSGDFYTTKDNVFLPSHTELNVSHRDAYEVGTVYSYFDNAGDEDRIAKFARSNGRYWTRTASSCSDYRVVSLVTSGRPVNQGADFGFQYVRPTLNLKYGSIISKSPNADGYYEILGGEVSSEPVQHSLTISKEGEGSTTLSVGKYEYELGTRKELTATPASGWLFQKWVIDGAEVTDTAIMINMNKDKSVKAYFVKAIGTQTLGDLNIGAKVVDNSWEWEYFPNEIRPVTWIVVAKGHEGPDTGVTLLAEDLIASRGFDNSTPLGSSHWGDSGTHENATYGLRPWLNSTGIHAGEGFYQAFSDAFQEAVLTTTVSNTARLQGSSLGYTRYTTQDKVFIPSLTELGAVHPEACEIGTTYPYFENAGSEDRIAKLDDINREYWTRTQLRASNRLLNISRNGGVLNGHNASDRYFGVRPALNLKPETPVSGTPNAAGAYEIIYEIYNIPATGVTLSPATASLTTTLQLAATFQPADATDKSVTWSSNDTAVATVSDSGLVRAVGPGTATITVHTTDGNHTATSTVTVTEAAGKLLGELNIGDKVVDKSWEWEYRTGPEAMYGDFGGPYSGTGETKPVTWIVVAKNHYNNPASAVTLLAEEVIGRFPLDNSTHIHVFGSNHWGNSGTHESASHGLRPWLNSTGIHTGEGFYQAFSDTFKEAVLTTTVPNRSTEGSAFYTTQDQVFIPSATELGHVTADSMHEIGTVYAHFYNVDNADRIAMLADRGESYWTRTPRAVSPASAYFLNGGDGTLRNNSARVYVIGARPALNIKSAIPISNNPNPEGYYEILGDKEIPEPVKHSLTVLREGQGSIDLAEGIHEYTYGTDVRLTATPAEGWQFEKWLVNGEEHADPTITVAMDANKTAKAYFTEAPVEKYELTISVHGQGTTNPSEGDHAYEKDTDVRLIATPAEGWQFEKWVMDETEITEAITVVTVSKNQSAKAHFIEIKLEQYNLTVSKEGQGIIEPALGSYTHQENTLVNLTAVPSSGWEFEKWAVDGEEYTEEAINVTMDANKTAKAYFIKTSIPDDTVIWETWESKLDIPKDKEWVIEFNKIIDRSTIKEHNIYVTDKYGQLVPMFFYQRLQDEDKKIYVMPARDYIPGETYTLWIKDLKAEDGSVLKKNVKMEFTIINE